MKVLLVSNQRPNANGVGNPIIVRMMKAMQTDERVDVAFMPFANSYSSLMSIRKAAKQADVVHIHFGGLYALLVRLFLIRVRAVKFITFHGTDIHAKSISTTSGMMQKVKIKLNQYASFLSLPLFRRVGFVAEAMIPYVPASLRKREGGKFFVQKLGVDYGLFRPMEKSLSMLRLQLPEGRYVLFSDINNTHIKRRDIAEKIVECLGNGRKLLIMSGVSPDEVPHYINVCDFLLLTSDEEGSPNIVRECLAMNKPVFSVEVGDVEQQLKGLTNSCIISREPQQAARQIAEHMALSYVDDTRVKRKQILDFNELNQSVIELYISEMNKVNV